ncbi:hypothetical protein F5Y16DRAFT_397872 [Xylariaceae sp. FL0255]|nr:hypothetical protein F5Y16DRAFT_397872 [Xylariaceae sp. FL0255]
MSLILVSHSTLHRRHLLATVIPDSEGKRGCRSHIAEINRFVCFFSYLRIEFAVLSSAAGAVLLGGGQQWGAENDIGREECKGYHINNGQIPKYRPVDITAEGIEKRVSGAMRVRGITIGVWSAVR